MADISKIKPLGSNTTYNIKDNSAIASITRSGTTFTATRRDGTTFTFNQQDNNTWNSLSTSQAGYVAKAPNDTNKFLRGDATWAKVTWDNIDGKPTNFSPSTHTHGNITSDGTLQENGITIGDGDKILITDNSNSQKIVKTSISFDGTTTIKALTQKGTWETFLPLSGGTITGNINVIGNAAFNNTTTIDDAIIDSLLVNGNSNFINNVNFIQIPTAPTAAAGTSTTQIATTEFVTNAVAQGFVANDAMVFKGLIGSNQPITQLPTSGYNAGWTYRVANAGIFAGEYCEVGDLLIAINDGPASGSSVINTDWGKVEHNIDGAVFRGSGASNSSVGSSTQPVYVNGSGIVTAITSLEVEAGGTGKDSRRKAGLFYDWTASLKGQKWSRICYIPYTNQFLGSTMILNIRHTRANVVYNETVMITVHHSSRGNITSLSSSNYHQNSIVQIRAVASPSGNCYIELKDSNKEITEGTAISPVYCTLQIISLGNDEPDLKTSFEDGTTLPENYSVAAEVTLGRNRIITSGIFSGNLEGNATTATTATNATQLISNNRMDYGWNGINYFNISTSNQSAAKVNDTPFSSNVWTHILRFNHNNASGYYTDLAIPFDQNSIYYKRIAAGSLQNSTTNGGWIKVLDQLNYTSYTVTKTGSGASGTWNINISGNAATASKLSNTSKIGDTNKPVYFKADGTPAAINYTIDKAVPSNAVFTDTKNTAGATNSTAKLFLIGAKTQEDNPQTYSNNGIYIGNNNKQIVIESTSDASIKIRKFNESDNTDVATISMYVDSSGQKGLYDGKNQKWIFVNSSDGTNSSISSNLRPSQTNTYSLGSADRYWNNIYVKDFFTKEAIESGTTYRTLMIGNETNRTGRINLYSGSKGGYIQQAINNTNNWILHQLPAESGWIVKAGNGTSTGAGDTETPIYVDTRGVAKPVNALPVNQNLLTNTQYYFNNNTSTKPIKKISTQDIPMSDCYSKYDIAPGTGFTDLNLGTFAPAPDTWYTLSFYAKANYNNITIRTYFYPNTTASSYNCQGFSTTADDGLSVFTVSTGWKRYWVCYKTSASVSGTKNLIARLISGTSPGTTLRVALPKLEVGQIMTPWVPHANDFSQNKISTCYIDNHELNNYQWHRIATCSVGTKNYDDRDIILFVHKGYLVNTFGILKISVRADTNAASPPIKLQAKWLLRHGFSESDCLIGLTRNSIDANSTATADIYFKTSTNYARIAFTVLNNFNKGFTLFNSDEIVKIENGVIITDLANSTEVYIKENVMNGTTVESIKFKSDTSSDTGITYVSWKYASDSLSEKSLIPIANNTYDLGSSSLKWNNVYANNLKGNADTATTLATGRTLKVNLASTSASTAFNGAANITDIGVSGILPIAQGGTGQNNTDNFVKAHTRSQMGNSINYDNPGVQGLFEARPASEITVTGKLPGGKQGHYPMLSLKAENVMMQIAGGYFGWWIRGRQKANVTLENIDWEQLVTNSGTWDINITGNADTATKLSNTSAIGSSTQPVYFNSSGQPVAVNTYDQQTGKTTSFVPRVGLDGVMEIGKYIDFHNTSEDTSDYIVRITARDSSETNGTGLTLTGTTVGTFKGNLNGTATTATQDANGNNIINTYLTKTAGVTNITWDNTNKKLIKTINNSNSDIVTLYAANLKLNNTAVYNTELEIKNIKIGNGSTSTSTKNVKLEYNETLETLNFVFS